MTGTRISRWLSCGLLLLLALPGRAEERRGGLVLQFDDGWSSWGTTIAPELARVGGKASGFVNNQHIRSGRITLEDLRTLQDTYGWEIGTHTYHHHRAPYYVRQWGLTNWLAGEVEAAIGELSDAGLRVRSLVFPYNALTPSLCAAVRSRVGSYRRAEPFALAAGASADGGVPGTAFDLTAYVPLALLQSWIDQARQRDKVLFLFGHRVLPESEFAVGRVSSVTGNRLTASAPLSAPPGEDLVLVPDTRRRTLGPEPLRVMKVEGDTVTVNDGADLGGLTQPGAEFIIGPMYGARLSEFRELIEHAAARVHFYTVSEIVEGKHQNRPTTPATQVRRSYSGPS
jgi:peptidoglycan/xylan/chitin deacetylase (PgdA/CDA1 family)